MSSVKLVLLQILRRFELSLKSQKRISWRTTQVYPLSLRSGPFVGMVVYYQQFIEGCSAIARPLFRLTTGPKTPRHGKGRAKRKVTRKLSASDWMDECRQAFNHLKQALLDQVDDASSNGLGAVLSQVPEGGDKAKPVAFASKSLTYA